MNISTIFSDQNAVLGPPGHPGDYPAWGSGIFDIQPNSRDLNKITMGPRTERGSTALRLELPAVPVPLHDNVL